jgi:hypothetical protein
MPAKRTKNGDGLADFAGAVPHFFGHRARLRQRLIAGGSEALPDYELLEVLLFAGNPRGDTKPLAKDLLQRFGSLAEVLSADSDDLLTVPGLGEAGVAALKSVREAALRLSRAELQTRPVLGSWDQLIDYCKASIAYAKVEEFPELCRCLTYRDSRDPVFVLYRGLTNWYPAVNLVENQSAGGSSVKIHAYKVVPRGQVSLDQVLDHINGLALGDRLRTVSEGDIRLEMGNKAGQLWVLDFGGIRPDGPGRASATAPISDFDMTADEGFGQETAAIYNVATGFMALQYNHFGPRYRRIQGYLFRFARAVAGLTEDIPESNDHGFTLSAVLKTDSVARLNQADIVKNLEVSVYLPGIAVIDENRRRSLSAILNHPLFGNAEMFTFQLRAPRHRGASLNLAAVRQFCGELLGLGDEVGALQVSVREAEEDPSEPLDLLEARLQADVPVERAGRRYGRNERWAALRQTLEVWAANGQLR